MFYCFESAIITCTFTIKVILLIVLMKLQFVKMHSDFLLHGTVQKGDSEP